MTFSPVLGPNIPVLEPAQRPPPTKTWVFFPLGCPGGVAAHHLGRVLVGSDGFPRGYFGDLARPHR